MDSSVDSDDSELSSSYNSDDVVECSNHKHRRTHSKGKRPLEFSGYSFLVYHNHCDIEKGGIYPQDVELYLPKDILRSIKSIPAADCTYVNSPLLTFLKPEEEVPAPHSVICDVYVFGEDRTFKVLTFVDAEGDDALHYNSTLAQSLTYIVRREHGSNFHLVHGVVRPEEWRNRDKFHKTLECLQLNVEKRILHGSLQYNAELFDSVKKRFFEMMLDLQVSVRQSEWVDLFVETAAYQDARAKLQQCGLLILIGSHGEGKTAIGQKLCYDYQQEGYNTVIYSRRQDFDPGVLQSKQPTLVVLDDMHPYVRRRFSRKRKNVHVVVIEEHDKEEAKLAKRLLGTSTITVDITETRNMNWERTKEEYSRMVALQTDIPDKTRDEIIARLPQYYLGFPKVIKQFWKETVADPLTYFTNPHTYFSTEVEKLFQIPNYVAGIVYILVSGNKVDLIRRDTVESDSESESESESESDSESELQDTEYILALRADALYRTGDNSVSVDDIPVDPPCKEYVFKTVDDSALDAVDTLFPNVDKGNLPDIIHKLNETYLFQQDNTVSFSDPLTYDVCVFYVDVKFPGSLWKHCSAVFEGDDCPSPNQNTILISRNNTDKLTDKLIGCVRRGEFRNTISHPVLTRENNTDRFFSEFGDLKVGLDLPAEHNSAIRHSFLYWVLRSGNNYMCKKVLQQLDLSGGHISDVLTSFPRLHQTKYFFHLWQNMPDPNSLLSFSDSDGNSFLMLAVIGNRKSVVKFLLDAGANPLTRNKALNTAIHLACMNGCAEIVEELVPHLGDRWNTKGEHSRTTLMMVAQYGSSHLYHYLTNNTKADLTGIDDYGNTILHLACEGGCLAIVRHIISSKLFNINCVGQYGKTPLMIAASMGHRDVFQLLLSQNCHLSPDHFSMTETLLSGHINNFKHLTEFLQSREHGGKFRVTPNRSDASLLLTCLQNKGSSMLPVDEIGLSLLHIAAETGNLDLAVFLLSKGKVDINTRDATGRTPVMLAAVTGHYPMFAFLVDKNCDLSVKDHRSSGILHFASQGGNVEIVRLLAKHGVNEENTCRKTPLSYSAEKGYKEIFEMFIDRGADISVVDTAKSTLLHLASEGGNVLIVEDILAFPGFDIDAVNSGKRTPLLVAAYNGHTDICEHLLSAGADVNIRDCDGNDVILIAAMTGNHQLALLQLSRKRTLNCQGDKHGKTPLMWAAEKGDAEMFDLLLTWSNMSDVDEDCNNVLHYACTGGNADIVRKIIQDNKVSIACRGHKFETPVALAAKKGHKIIFEFLLENGIDMTELSVTNRDILHHACSGGSVPIVEYLLSDKTTDINSKNKLHMTPVMCAVEMGHKSVFDHLVSKNCDLSQTDAWGDNILHMACRSGQATIVDDIFCLGLFDIDCRGQNRKTPVLWAAEMGHKRVFDLLVHKGCDLTISDDHGDSILHKACYGGNVDIIEYVLSSNIVNMNRRNNFQKTPVMCAVEKGQRRVFDRLVRKGCDLKVKYSNGDNILHTACFGGNLDIIEYILSHQIVDINSRDHLGRTALMWAAQKGHIHIFELLVHKGADLSLLPEFGHGDTLLHIACSGGNAEIVRYIVSCNVVDINSCGWFERTPLDIAKHLNHEAVVDILVSCGASSKD